MIGNAAAPAHQEHRLPIAGDPRGAGDPLLEPRSPAYSRTTTGGTPSGVSPAPDVARSIDPHIGQDSHQIRITRHHHGSQARAGPAVHPAPASSCTVSAGQPHARRSPIRDAAGSAQGSIVTAPGARCSAFIARFGLNVGQHIAGRRSRGQFHDPFSQPTAPPTSLPPGRNARNPARRPNRRNRR